MTFFPAVASGRGCTESAPVLSRSSDLLRAITFAIERSVAREAPLELEEPIHAP